MHPILIEESPPGSKRSHVGQQPSSQRLGALHPLYDLVLLRGEVRLIIDGRRSTGHDEPRIGA